MPEIRRAAERSRAEQPGITTFHCFAAGAHYDADNVAFGPLIACDEHRLEPGAGFGRHRHARVELVSWVLDGTLRHEGVGGAARDVGPGRVLHQRAGRGIEHAEGNASAAAALRFVQFWLLADEDEPADEVGTPPLRFGRGSFDVVRGAALIPAAPYVHLFVAAGRFTVAGAACAPGDSVRARTEAVRVEGTGQLLVLTA